MKRELKAMANRCTLFPPRLQTPMIVVCSSVLLALALFAPVAVVAKISMLGFMFHRDPMHWTPTEWLAMLGFMNNIIRRDRSESSRVDLLELEMVGHYIPALGRQTDLSDKLIVDFYEHMMDAVLKGARSDQ
eukprot:gene36240-40415_t